MSPSDEFVSMNTMTAARTVSLPFTSSVAVGTIVTIKDSSSSAGAFELRVAPQGSDEIDGLNTYKVINAPYGSISVRSNDTGSWWVL
jgi:hypothetical protein